MHDVLSYLPGDIHKEELLKRRNELEKVKGLSPYAQYISSLNFFTKNFKHQTSHLSVLNGAIKIGKKEELSKEQGELLHQTAIKLIPWKKGPFNLFETTIDAEWRSDLKWERLKDKLPSLESKCILDIGTNNGYFMFRMLESGPKLILGIDPVVTNWCQFSLLHHLYPDPRLYYEMWGVDEISLFSKSFDIIFSMGILYHHRNPLQQLLEMKNALTPGGTLILETIIIPGEESVCLFPEERYAKMRNVWFLPTKKCLINWLKRCKFHEIEVLSESTTTVDEQRNTLWHPPPAQSLSDFLHAKDSCLTIEGYPRPIRLAIKAIRHKNDLSIIS